MRRELSQAASNSNFHLWVCAAPQERGYPLSWGAVPPTSSTSIYTKDLTLPQALSNALLTLCAVFSGTFTARRHCTPRSNMAWTDIFMTNSPCLTTYFQSYNTVTCVFFAISTDNFIKTDYFPSTNCTTIQGLAFHFSLWHQSS